MNYREEILSYVTDYLKLVKWDFKAKKDSLILVCPFCKNPAQTAQQIPNSYKLTCLNPQCPNKGKKFSLISFIRLTESKKLQWDEKNILHHIKIKLGLDIQSPIDRENVGELFKMYKENGFSLLPVRRFDKDAIEKQWEQKEHKEIGEWEEFIKRDVNIGLRTGEVSNLTIVDIDCLTKKEEYELLEIYNNKSKIKRKQELKSKIKIPQEIKKLMGETLIQKTWKGFHLFYKYESELRKSPIILEETNIDIENNGGYIIICPSIIHRYYKIKEPGTKKYNDEKFYVIKTKREFINTNSIIEMSKELKEMIIEAQKKRGNNKEEDKLENSIELDIMNENFKIDPKDFNLKYNGLEGCCNDSFIRLGGVLRKQLNAQNTEYVLRVLNKHMLEDPMENKVITALTRQLNKYDWFNEEKLNNDVLNYIKDSEESSKDDIERVLVGNRPKGEDKLRLDKCIAYLLRENYIKKIRGVYIPVRRLELRTSLIDTYKPVNYKVPYFDDIMYFAEGDLIVIGAKPGSGKTHLAMNIVKRLKIQNEKPIYVSTEPGSRYKKISLKMGLIEADYEWAKEKDTTAFEFEDNRITIIDWLQPEQYKYTDKILKHFNDQLEKHGGLCFLFMQLNEEGGWFAKNLIKFYPAFAVKYLWEDGSNGERAYFQLEKVRESTQRFRKSKKIPTMFNWDTEEVLRLDEIKENKTIKAVPIEEVNLGSGEEK